ncbi:hypothetical protein EV122DRAFT_211457 [Schizophyllum commune]|nr:uncharacterized protein SCHCODRAFT_02134605 [Schizophyllum commune H4-8]KAI5885224.1 hypothetical protein SCHCODRAFT_02134605 [Schizophyllum commune H4-8]
MSLLQGVLRSSATNAELDKSVDGLCRPGNDKDTDSDEEWVNVVSVPGTPARTRPPSPTRGSRPASRTPILTSKKSRDPLRVFPTEVSQRIFSRLRIRDLLKCTLVCKKWARSQTLNYVWYQHYRKENYNDDSLPSGKWTKRESKQNWRLTYLKSENHAPEGTSFTLSSGYASPMTGQQTPREMREEKWKQEAEVTRPGKLEMRAKYKELGGRKARGKGKVGGGGGRDKGGWDAGDDF